MSDRARRLRLLARKTNAVENSFTSLERESWEREGSRHFFERELVVKLDRGGVSCVSKEPSFVGPLADPSESDLRERVPYSVPSTLWADEDSG